MCDLCTLQIKTKVYYENDYFIILDCTGCSIPMAVWKEHTMDIPEPDQYIMEAVLQETADMFYEGKAFHIDKVQRTIFDHLHCHAREV